VIHRLNVSPQRHVGIPQFLQQDEVGLVSGLLDLAFFLDALMAPS